MCASLADVHREMKYNVMNPSAEVSFFSGPEHSNAPLVIQTVEGVTFALYL